MISIYAPFAGTATITQTPYGTDSHNTSSYWGAAFDFDLDANDTSGSGDSTDADRQALAVATGVVVAAVDGTTSNSGSGNYVTILFNPGESDQFYASYWHLAGGSVSVSIGDEVRAGTVVGWQGNTGGSDGAHLHFQWSREILVRADGVVSNATNLYDGLIDSLSGDTTLGAGSFLQGTLVADLTPKQNNVNYIVGNNYIAGETLVGNAGDNWFQGGPGEDSYDGRGGVDTVDFTDRPNIQWTVDLDPLAGFATVTSGGSGTEQLRNIENVNLGNGNDIIRMSDATNVVRAGGGTDTIEYDAPIERIWFLRADSRIAGAFVYTDDGFLPADAFSDVETIRSSASNASIDLTSVQIGQLGVGSTSSSTNYVLPLSGFTSAVVDGGGGFNILTVFGHAANWVFSQISANIYRIYNSSGNGNAEAGPGVTVDLTNIDAVTFDDGTQTIQELIDGTTTGGTSANIGIRVMAGQDPFQEEDNGSLAGYDFEVYSDTALSSNLYINWRVRGDGAHSANSSDFWDGSYPSGRERLDAGDLTSRISVDILGDNIPEFDEGFRIEIWLDSGDSDRATVVQQYAYGTIVNDDGTVWEGDDNGDTFATATLLINDLNKIDGIIEQVDDRDMFTAYLFAELEYSFYFGDIIGASGNRFSNGSFSVYDAAGTTISYTDRNPNPSQVSFDFQPTADGVYYFKVDSPFNDDTGEYQILYSVNDNSLVDRLPAGLSGVPTTLTSTDSSKWFALQGTNAESPAVSLQTDLDLNDLNLSLFGINGQRVNGNWVQVAAGVYNFNFLGTGSEQFLLHIEALNSNGYGAIAVDRYYQSWHLPAMQVNFDGDNSANALTANGLDNRLRGFNGNDTLTAGRGNDILFGGWGDDTLEGDEGDDLFIGGAGRDEIIGGAGIDVARYADSGTGVQINLATNSGHYGTAEGDRFFLIENIVGSSFADIITGDSSANALYGNASHDYLLGGAGDDTVRGGDGIDRVFGDDGDDSLFGDEGTDIIHGGLGSDTIYGGTHSDTIYGNSNDDRIFGGDGNDRLFGHWGDDRILGGKGNDTIFGGPGTDYLSGESGHDSLTGGDGNDTIYGGAGNDALIGEEGNDRLFGEVGLDTILAGNGNDTLFGGGSADKMFGGNGNDHITGDQGADTLVGGAGNDILVGGTAGGFVDVFLFGNGFGQDRIEDFDIGLDVIKFNISGLSFADLTLTGSIAGTTVSYDGNSILVAGIPSYLLGESDFVF